MGEPDRKARAGSFGSVAEEYARYRPAPPREAAEWAVGARPRVVVDLAAGTGNLTEHLVALGAGTVVAVDADARMLGVLERRVATAIPVVARGEELPLCDASADAVTISSAWHWLDHERAWPEMARVVRPGGRLAVMWGGPDRRQSWVSDVLGHGSDSRSVIGGGGPPAWVRHRSLGIPPRIPFEAVEERIFETSIPFAVADLPGLAASYSRVITLDGAARRKALSGVAFRAATHPELVGKMVDLPLRCRVWRARRADPGG